MIKLRATLSFSDELIEDLVRETGAKNKTQAITRAIEGLSKEKTPGKTPVPSRETGLGR